MLAPVFQAALGLGEGTRESFVKLYLSLWQAGREEEEVVRNRELRERVVQEAARTGLREGMDQVC